MDPSSWLVPRLRSTGACPCSWGKRPGRGRGSPGRPVGADRLGGPARRPKAGSDSLAMGESGRRRLSSGRWAVMPYSPSAASGLRVSEPWKEPNGERSSFC
jgi:hypothetical protein